MDEDELLLYLSSRGVTRVGAAALEKAWATYIDRGEWRFQEGGGYEVTAAYQLGPLPRKVPVRFVGKDGHYTATLSDLHFTEATCRGIARCVEDSIGYGWRYYPAAKIAWRAS